jgi:LmbE family N-acetylglucosaminyl deacetylase
LRNAVRDLQRFARVLVVFPHPDDETVSCGGTIRQLADAGASITLVLLTAGERGTRSGTLDPQLRARRRSEAESAARILGISDVVHEDFPDGYLAQHASQAMALLARIIARIEPDLILTYDRAGLDGHPDHVACSEIVTELERTRLSRGCVWYVAPPAWLVGALQGVGQMPRDRRIDAQRAVPTHRVSIRSVLSAKNRAWQAHQSQRGAIRKGLGRLVPAWLAITAWPFEYFADMP